MHKHVLIFYLIIYLFIFYFFIYLILCYNLVIYLRDCNTLTNLDNLSDGQIASIDIHAVGAGNVHPEIVLVYQVRPISSDVEAFYELLF